MNRWSEDDLARFREEATDTANVEVAQEMASIRDAVSKFDPLFGADVYKALYAYRDRRVSRLWSSAFAGMIVSDLLPKKEEHDDDR